jgi:HlyD family secretion protein
LVTALGRFQPKDGVIRVAGPSQPSVVIARLLVDKGDHVQAGQVIATLDSLATATADLDRVQFELEHAKSEFERLDKLYQSKVVSISERDNWRMKANMLDAERRRAQVELDRASVRAPISGQVLDIHTRAGEKLGPDGIMELGQTDQMYAIAEVYETDIGRVRVGQHASVSSRALPKPVTGTVERIGLKIGKADTLGVDPIAKTDARVVEVEIRLDNNKDVATLTNAQVEVTIGP